MDFVAAGAAHAVWRFRSPPPLMGCVLRVSRHGGDDASASTFVANVLTPLLGCQFVRPPLATLRLPAQVLNELREASASISPETAASLTTAAMAALESGGGVNGGGENGGGDGDSGLATLDVDHATLRLSSSDGAAAAAEPVATPALCVELKPKAGVLPAGPPLVTAHPGCSRYCLHVRSKRHQQLPADYCPLDFFSAEPLRLRRALSALLRLGPALNNLRLFSRDGSQVYGAGHGTHAALSRELRRELLQPTEGAAVDVEEEAAMGEADAEALLVEVLAAIFEQEPLLPRLSAAHALDQKGAASAAAACARAQELLGSEAALAARIADWGSSSSDAMPGSPELNGCIEELRRWLIALTASDVSLLIALRRLDADGDVPQLPQPQPASGLAPGVVRVRGGEVVVAYRVAVVDVQPKAVSKARAHADLDERIAAMPPLRSSCLERGREVGEVGGAAHD